MRYPWSLVSQLTTPTTLVPPVVGTKKGAHTYLVRIAKLGFPYKLQIFSLRNLNNKQILWKLTHIKVVQFLISFKMNIFAFNSDQN